MSCILINVGSGGSNPNGRGRIFDDGTYEYLPLPEQERTSEKIPTYRDIGFEKVKFPDIAVHLDPEFETYTYGHVIRGFGDVRLFVGLKAGGMLVFYSTLQNGHHWAPYIIGYFFVDRAIDCRNFQASDIFALRSEGFQNNAHLKRIDPQVDFLVKGDDNSRLLKKAFRMTETTEPLALRKSLRNLLFTPSGRAIGDRKPWYRWTLICKNPSELLQVIAEDS
ncbi:MAG: hypothetical protein JRN37_04175 [Nitrososphaerota archaeon]|jgi:hypothetical protein|nr:hypothetical protein [Nitrososphaerota archaeon]MDG7036246.1 hypothetical protein [Nitrososphaerota archaeon]MDG7038343.1 hypothetical protein [Nitrososphaerota archaeon]